MKGRHGDAEMQVPRVPVSPFLPLSPLARWRNAILGTLLVLAGLGAAAVTLLAGRTNDSTLATVGAALSLVIAGLILILIVPPLARSARLEIASFDLPIEVTTGGAIFLAIVVVVGFAAWNTGHN
ncbi:MAG: hypothetical protein M3447_07760, partial [Acidobacteriota bacterium]|nr:hypothetical protein [Acidobacteriota bacterium]